MLKSCLYCAELNISIVLSEKLYPKIDKTFGHVRNFIGDPLILSWPYREIQRH